MVINAFNGSNVDIVLDGLQLKAIRQVLTRTNSDQILHARQVLAGDGYDLSANDVASLVSEFCTITGKITKLIKANSEEDEEPEPTIQ